MFTGIVEETATIVALESDEASARISFKAPTVTESLAIGDSIAVSGACLTVTRSDGDVFGVDVITETLRRTNLGDRTVGDGVNVERAMPVNGRFDGHIVQGHVDATGTIVAVDDQPGERRLRVSAPQDLLRYVVEKGSITIDGVSLTVAAVGGDWFEVALIPHTLEITTLGTNRQGDRVNLEADILAKYVERLSRRDP